MQKRRTDGLGAVGRDAVSENQRTAQPIAAVHGVLLNHVGAQARRVDLAVGPELDDGVARVDHANAVLFSPRHLVVLRGPRLPCGLEHVLERQPEFPQIEVAQAARRRSAVIVWKQGVQVGREPRVQARASPGQIELAPATGIAPAQLALAIGIAPAQLGREQRLEPRLRFLRRRRLQVDVVVHMRRVDVGVDHRVVRRAAGAVHAPGVRGVEPHDLLSVHARNFELQLPQQRGQQVHAAAHGLRHDGQLARLQRASKRLRFGVAVEQLFDGHLGQPFHVGRIDVGCDRGDVLVDQFLDRLSSRRRGGDVLDLLGQPGMRRLGRSGEHDGHRERASIDGTLELVGPARRTDASQVARRLQVQPVVGQEAQGVGGPGGHLLR